MSLSKSTLPQMVLPTTMNSNEDDGAESNAENKVNDDELCNVSTKEDANSFDTTVEKQQEELDYYSGMRKRNKANTEQKQAWETFWNQKGRKRKKPLTVEEKKRRVLVKERKQFQKDFFNLKKLVVPRIKNTKYAGDVFSEDYAENIPY